MEYGIIVGVSFGIFLCGYFIYTFCRKEEEINIPLNENEIISKSLLLYDKEIKETLFSYGTKPANQFLFFQENIECPICMENIQLNEKLYNITCQHLFHQNCLIDCCKNKLLCPNCRIPITKQ